MKDLVSTQSDAQRAVGRVVAVARAEGAAAALNVALYNAQMMLDASFHPDDFSECVAMLGRLHAAADAEAKRLAAELIFPAPGAGGDHV